MFEKGLQGYQVEVGPLKPPWAQAWAQGPGQGRWLWCYHKPQDVQTIIPC